MKDFCQLESSKDKEFSNALANRKKIQYQSKKTLGFVIEELTQRIVAIAAKVRRYQERLNRFKQNRMFQNNQMQFYRELNQEGERCDDEQPHAEESEQFGETYGMTQQIIIGMRNC